VNSGIKKTIDKGKGLILDSENDQDLSYLPNDFDPYETRDKRKEDVDKCELCRATFTQRLTALNVLRKQNPARHCKKCARAICDVCSD